MTNADPYRGLSAALLTQHGKEALLSPLIAQAGISLARVSDFATDTLGTFTRDVARAGSQLAAARRKAQIALERSDARLGLGSEGAFTLDPHAGLIPWNIELVLLIDRELGIEIAGFAESEQSNVGQKWCASAAELNEFAGAHGFPVHALILEPRALNCDTRVIPLVKGIVDPVMLSETAAPWLAQGGVWVETDMRAHLNPSRQRVIAAATHDLLSKIASCCPACATPGFGRVRALRGRLCGGCVAPTQLPHGWLSRCQRCGAEDSETIDALADPGQCEQCNP